MAFINKSKKSKRSSSAFNALNNLRMKLLDLTAKNRLINFRHTKKGSLRLIDGLPNRVVETLLAGSEMRFQAIPEPTDRDLIAAGYLKIEQGAIVRLRKEPTAEEWAMHIGLSNRYEAPERDDYDKGDQSRNTFQTLLYPHETEMRLKSLLQTSESAIQEMGANILYLAFGFLEWYESTNSDSMRLAPLFLLPVRLNKGRLNPETGTYQYTLSYSGEDIIPNLSLREKLRMDFAMGLPEMSDDTMPEEYFREVKALIAKNQTRWRVRRHITLSLLNFSKLLMYLDLDPERWPKDKNIVDHPVVSCFLSGYDSEAAIESESAGDLGFGEEYPIDEMNEIHEQYPLIEDADSSQHSALIDAINGKNLVIEGPPGTGKSQTITNLIAAAMARGKKVLFVAEKLAALEVVKRHLDAAGLGIFCLELHSHKSQKRKVLDEVEERLKKHGKYRKPQDIEEDISRYEKLKSKLKRYADKINRPWRKTGKTPHQIFMAATRFRNAIGFNPEKIHPVGYGGGNYRPKTQRRNEDQVSAFGKIHKAVAAQLKGSTDLQEHPWFGVRNAELQIFDLDRIKESLGIWQDALRQLNEERISIAETIDCEHDEFAESLTDLDAFLQELNAIPDLRGDELLDRLPYLRNEVLEKTKLYLQLFVSIQELYASLEKQVGSKALKDPSILDAIINGVGNLVRLVDQSTEIGKLVEAIDKLDSILEKMVEIELPLSGMMGALGQKAATHLSFSESGLREFNTIFELVTLLSPSYWKHRDAIFDNEELDELLPRLRSDIEELRELGGMVEDLFTLDDLPDEDEIRKLQMVLNSGGLFRWFKGEWRRARKKLRGFSLNTRTSLSCLKQRIGALADFEGKRRKLENNTTYRDALGDRFQGMNTDLETAEVLRGWYKQVRKKYGVGFGQKVALGDAIVELTPNDAQAVRSLADQGVHSRINFLLEDLAILRDIFSPVEQLKQSDTPLNQEQGVIPHLIGEIKEALHNCGPVAEDPCLTIRDAADLIKWITLLKKMTRKWVDADFDRKLFQGRLGLKLGLDVDNAVGLSVLRNTIALAECIEGKLHHQNLLQYIYRHPDDSTFGSLAAHALRTDKAMSAQMSALDAFKEIVQLNWGEWSAKTGDHLENLIARNQKALEHEESLYDWLDYVRVTNQMVAIGMERLVCCVEKNELPIDQVENAYKAGIFDLLAREILKKNPELGSFSGHSQKACQEQFREYDKKLKALQREKIAWMIDQTEIPVGKKSAKVSELTDLALLEHECGKKKRHLPIRQLLLRAGNALVSLKPCFMMGPMSVAQYLAPGEIRFDIVVMDEASQIKPQDALGAVARGAQLVVVGDPKQLPPTSFFEIVVNDDEEDPTAIEESESILNAAQTMFSSRRLRWHYRSQHESLIAFSNYSFYNSDLVLFPSPHKLTDGHGDRLAEEYGIRYSRISRGCFVNRRNMEEARIISKAVKKHLRCQPEETIGIVTMNAEQRLQIESEIEKIAKEDPQFQECLDRDAKRHEPLFIKNLENVQGDERDVIFISLTYGPQKPGKNVPQRFGPINAETGWRRLNVLFTRAKKRMRIFSSMGSDDIVIGPTSKRGVKALRDFLSFCETGILYKTKSNLNEVSDSDFELAVMSALNDEGFECAPQVGAAGFFIDVAVIDPGNPCRYLMGIECDGATYHSAKSTRDRDRLRQEILERLGWNIRRIWSTDWFKNPKGILNPIIRELNELKSAITVEPEGGCGVDPIEEMVKEVESVETQIDPFAYEGLDLKDMLVRFDRQVIRRERPETPENKRLLRPAMIEALLEYMPTSRMEFLEMIPLYIRGGTDPAEGKYLEQVFEIINASLETM